MIDWHCSRVEPWVYRYPQIDLLYILQYIVDMFFRKYSPSRHLQLLLQVSVRMMEAQPRKPGWELRWGPSEHAAVRVDDLKGTKELKKIQKGQEWTTLALTFTTKSHDNVSILNFLRSHAKRVCRGNQILNEPANRSVTKRSRMD